MGASSLASGFTRAVIMANSPRGSMARRVIRRQRDRELHDRLADVGMGDPRERLEQFLNFGE
jgi:hypothetical protein